MGGLIGGDYVRGMALLTLLLLVCLALAIWGWYRRMPLFYLPWRPTAKMTPACTRCTASAPRPASHRVDQPVAGATCLIAVGYILVSSLVTRMTGDIQMDLIIAARRHLL